MTELAAAVQQSNATAQAADALRTRVENFGKLAARASTLKAALDALAESGRPVAIDSDVEGAAACLRALGERLGDQTFNAREALDSQPIVEGLDRVEASVRAAWMKLTTADDHALDLAGLLSRFPDFQKACREIGVIAKRLTERRERLPADAKDVKKALADHEQVGKVLEGLASDGLDEEVVKFLRRVSQGYPLNELLSNEKTLKWLRRHASEFVLVPKQRST